MKHILLVAFSFIFLYAFSAVIFSSVVFADTTADPQSADMVAEADAASGVETIELRGSAGEAFTLEGARSQDDDAVRSFTWTQTGGPFKFDTRDGGLTSIVPPEAGTYEFELTVTDGDERRVEKRVTLVVEEAPSSNVPGLDSETEVIERSEDARGATPGVRLAPSQTRVILLPSAGPSDDTEPSPRRLDGIVIDVLDPDSDDDGVSDDTESVVSNEGGVTIRANGVTVRGWDPKDKEAVRASTPEPENITTANDLGLYIASVLLKNENIEEITTDKDATEVTYTSTVYLFGFIPKSVTAIARVEPKGEVSTDYPWYGFLARKGNSQNNQTDIDFLTSRIRGGNDRIVDANGAR